ncbi:fatty acid desaturase [Plasmopara halstedii]|uniref:Fatty acid desaturase n=1 Tax=Plasmopara halstedii TaxID=4781 RepID=A0A0P1B2D5_PLAHL|nr:fatty acid desaturase [Plasmopara halstedii]CEG48398.1 fatty acid desaturase [Plasmopara halstedii]|eukprot:XP_024584767.1 fatty acid desaturase [Plasmopara halstedii]
MATEQPYVFPSLMEIKQSLPRECFEASVPLSLYYTVRSLVIALSLVIGLNYARALPVVQGSWVLDAAICTGYIFLLGIVFWGFFTLGHDAGHGSFSRYHLLNFVVGTLMHSLILTPFESWKLTHRHHHKNTGNIDRDEIFYPQRKADDHPLSRNLTLALGIAWFVYLLEGYPPRRINHFNPFEPLFVRQVSAVIVSLFAYLFVLGLSIYLTFQLGFKTMALYYYAPVMVFGSMLVIVTFLHHNDEETPWYADSEWTYVKGNLSSVDRSYGTLIDNLSHNIGTHQIHHLFPIIPHYKLKQATSAFRQAFPELIRKNDEPILKAFFRIRHLYAKFGVAESDAKVFTLKEAKAMTETAAKSKTT